MVKHAIRFMLLFSWIFLPLYPGEKTLSLEEAIARALTHSPDIITAQKELEAVRGKRIEIGALPDPGFVFSREGLQAAPEKGEQEITFGVEQLIEFPGKKALRRQAAASEEEILSAELQSLKLVVTAEVKKAFFKAVHSQTVVTRIEELQEVLKQYQEMAVIRFQAGQVSSLDVLRGRLESLRVRGELIEARRKLREDLASLTLILGEESDGLFSVAGDLSFNPLEKDLSTLRAEAEARPSLRAASFRVEQARSSLLLAQKSALPDFTVGLYYPSLRTSSWGFSVGASIPLWRDRRKGQVLQAEAAIEAAAAGLEARRRKVLTLLEAAYADVRAAEERLALFEKSLLREVESMLELGISQYRHGQIDSLNMLDVYKFYKTTKLEYLGALLAHKIVLADLEAAGER
ncbi:MAG: TolC family protein [Clostridiales bacterium]|nr:TolC family protein [Clostridiales bacterium]